MTLLRIFHSDGCWWAEYVAGCDIATVAITFGEALWLEGVAMKHEWPKISIDCPEGVERILLLYWIELWTNKPGEWVHPEDKKNHKRWIKAANTLLEFFE